MRRVCPSWIYSGPSCRQYLCTRFIFIRLPLSPEFFLSRLYNSPRFFNSPPPYPIFPLSVIIHNTIGYTTCTPLPLSEQCWTRCRPGHGPPSELRGVAQTVRRPKYVLAWGLRSGPICRYVRRLAGCQETITGTIIIKQLYVHRYFVARWPMRFKAQQMDSSSSAP